MFPNNTSIVVTIDNVHGLGSNVTMGRRVREL